MAASIPAEMERLRNIAAEGYNKAGDTYIEWATSKPHAQELRLDVLEQLYSHIDNLGNARVLELGCGGGDPVTVSLAKRCRSVLANDISSHMITRARETLDKAGLGGNVEFLEGDMTELSIPANSLDAVVGFYSIIHLPRDDQTDMIKQVHGWLKEGGCLLICFPEQDIPAMTNEDWLGMTAYWSSWGREGSVTMVKDAGFEIVSEEVRQDEVDIGFLWVIARKNVKI